MLDLQQQLEALRLDRLQGLWDAWREEVRASLAPADLEEVEEVA